MNVDRFFEIARFLSRAYISSGLEKAMFDVCVVPEFSEERRFPFAIDRHIDAMAQKYEASKSSLEAAIEVSDLSSVPQVWEENIQRLSLNNVVGSAILQRLNEIENSHKGNLKQISKDFRGYATFVQRTYRFLASVSKGVQDLGLKVGILQPGEALAILAVPSNASGCDLEIYVSYLQDFKDVLETCQDISDTENDSSCALRSIDGVEPVATVSVSPRAAILLLMIVRQCLQSLENNVALRELKMKSDALGLSSEVAAMMMNESAAKARREQKEFVDFIVRSRALDASLSKRLTEAVDVTLNLIKSGVVVGGWAMDEASPDTSKVSQAPTKKDKNKSTGIVALPPDDRASLLTEIVSMQIENAKKYARWRQGFKPSPAEEKDAQT